MSTKNNTPLKGLSIQVCRKFTKSLGVGYIYVLYSGTHRMMESVKQYHKEDTARKKGIAFAQVIAAAFSVEITAKIGKVIPNVR